MASGRRIIFKVSCVDAHYSRNLNSAGKTFQNEVKCVTCKKKLAAGDQRLSFIMLQNIGMSVLLKIFDQRNKRKNAGEDPVGNLRSKTRPLVGVVRRMPNWQQLLPKRRGLR